MLLCEQQMYMYGSRVGRACAAGAAARLACQSGMCFVHCLHGSCNIVKSLSDLQASEKEFSSSAKDYLVDSLRQQAVDSETVTRHAMALRRSALWAAAWSPLA